MDNNREIGQKPQRFEEHENDLKGIKKFFGEKEAAFFHTTGREITEEILQESFLLYRLDLKKTRTHKLYGEAKIKRWKPEIEIFGRINVDVTDPSFHVKGGLVKKGMGQFTAHIYIEHLEELNLVSRKADNEIILGIKTGDFIGFKGQYYEIYDDGYANISNKHSWAGDRRFYVTIKGYEVDDDIFKAR
jgi:predicted Zn-dependent protease